MKMMVIIVTKTTMILLSREVILKMSSWFLKKLIFRHVQFYVVDWKT
jgi:hypothetical protein